MLTTTSGTEKEYQGFSGEPTASGTGVCSLRPGHAALDSWLSHIACIRGCAVEESNLAELTMRLDLSGVGLWL